MVILAQKSIRSARILAIVLVTILTVPMFVTAQSTVEFTRDYDYSPSGSYNETQNRLDDSASNNQQTWNPTTNGIYYGGFSKESQMNVDIVPDDDCRIVMAQVLKFDSSIVMNGASYFIVRLPFGTTQYRATLDIYQIDRTSNWTFEKNDTYGQHTRDTFRVNFTSGQNHSLVYWSYYNYPTDLSPTNGNDYYTRDGRSYQMVRAPIHSDTYYLFVATAHFNSSTQPRVYWQPDDLCDDWNRSTFASYNKIAPDTDVIEIRNSNVSVGFSFDFREGFGAYMTGISEYMGANSQVEFYRRIKDPDTTKYFTIMFPFYASITNVSIRVFVQAFDFAGNDATIIDDTQEWTDFILVSTTSDVATEIGGAWSNHWEGWVKITLWFTNTTRFRFHLRDIGWYESGFNESWIGNPTGHGFDDWSGVHAPDWRWQPQHYFTWNDTNGIYWIHWQIQCYVQLNDYYWTQHIPPADSRPEEPTTWDTLVYASKFFFAKNRFMITMDDDEGTFSLTPLGGFIYEHGLGPTKYIAGLLVDGYSQLTNALGFVQDTLDRGWDALREVGSWLWKVGQAIVGAVSWFIESITYYGSIILGILILVVVIAFLIFLPLWATAKVSSIIVNVATGRTEKAVDEMGEVTGTVGKTIRGK